MADHNNPQSRTEEILIATIDGTEYDKLPQSRLEELLLELKEVIEAGGGGGGTTNYNNLSNLPKINNVIVKGEMTASDLSLVLAEVGKGLSTNDYSDEEKAKVADLITAIEGILTGSDIDSFGDVEAALADKVDKVNGKGLSTNDFTNTYKDAVDANTTAITAIKDGTDIDSFGDVEVALLDKADTSDLGTAAAKDSTNSVTAGSTDLVESGAVKDAIDAAVASAYHHAGTKTVAQLTHDLLIAANEGNVYNITDSGTTTSDFIEGIGKQIDAGDNVGICKVGNVYMFDLLSGLEDTSIFVQKSQTSGLLKNDGTVNTTIEDIVAGHTTAIAGKQDALTFDDTPTDGSNNPVKSNGIYDSEKDIYVAMGEIGAKNLISYPYHQNTKTEYGVTFTNNGDGSVTVSTVNTGATAEATFICHNRLNTEANELRVKNGKYILSGCPQGGSATTYLLTTNRTYNGSSEAMGNEYGSGKVITLNGDDYGADGVNLGISIVVKSGTIITTPITFNPMLRLASDTDNTYQPYAKTNKQLTDDVALLDSEKANTDMVASDFDATASYTTGNYCIYEGKFYKFKNNHSGEWSAADVDEIKIAGELSSVKSGLIVQTVSINTEKAIGTAYKMGNVVFVNILNGTYFNASAEDVLFTLPEGYRPDGEISILNGFGNKQRITLNSNGKVVAMEAFENTYLRFCATFIKA